MKHKISREVVGEGAKVCETSSGQYGNRFVVERRRGVPVVFQGLLLGLEKQRYSKPIPRTRFRQDRKLREGS